MASAGVDYVAIACRVGWRVGAERNLPSLELVCNGMDLNRSGVGPTRSASLPRKHC